jgi:hypothetical protein
MNKNKAPITYPSNSITPTIITTNMNQPHQVPTQNQQQESQQHHGEPSKSSNNQSQPPNLPEFFMYPENIINEGVNACSRSILGKIITDKSIHISSIQNGLESIWGSPQGLKVQEIEGKILQFFMDK